MAVEMVNSAVWVAFCDFNTAMEACEVNIRNR